MVAIAGIISVAKLLAKITQRSDVGCRLCQRAREQRGARTTRCEHRKYAGGDRMGTSTESSAMKLPQPSRLHTNSSGDICMPACMQAAQTTTSKLRLFTPDTAGKWRKCESYFGASTPGSQLGRAMNWMDRPRTSADGRMLSGRRAVVIA